jgi:ABC-type multidrug transport system permease subunit
MSHHHHDPAHEHHHPPKQHWAKRFWWAVLVGLIMFAFVAFYLINLIMY